MRDDTHLRHQPGPCLAALVPGQRLELPVQGQAEAHQRNLRPLQRREAELGLAGQLEVGDEVLAQPGITNNFTIIIIKIITIIIIIITWPATRTAPSWRWHWRSTRGQGL